MTVLLFERTQLIILSEAPAADGRDSQFRPASSIYSEPTPSAATTRFPTNIYSNATSYNDDVSPPSSPDIATMKKSQIHEHDVSPIDETPDISRLAIGRPGSRLDSKTPSSSIPILRREKRRNQVAQAAANVVTRKEVAGRASKDVRWDPYSGETTNSEKGRPQTVKPGQFTPPGLHSPHAPTGRPYGNESNISAAPKTQRSFGERVRNLKMNAPERPEWKGASGRVALVSPMADQLDVPPLNIPRKSSKRVASPLSGSPSPVSVIRSGGGETSPVSQPELFDPTIRTALSNHDRDVPRVLDTPLATPPEAVLKAPSDNAQNAQVYSLQKQDSVGAIERNFREAFKDVGFSGHNPENSDPSTHYPRPSTDTFDRPPMPTPPQSNTTNQQPSPILGRKRPKVVESPKSTMRKAVPSSPVFISMTSSMTSKRGSNITKSLPQSPAEAQSRDLISTLEAQLEDLAHRRNNITKSIRQMTELMPTDGVLINDEVRRKRELEKTRVEGLREEEADVRRQEHDIGLRLHRAYKRKDNMAEFEPTGLWVRRVGSG
ncbi:hypothetical protein D0Z07_4026 [Hyphodiscus hymeniophilus]|uniref:Uncharacterized protein n=1 Tax=Hyphodiscus hymeniophilus TaxID=353542 RepID=A0A9P6VL48_9HELO|nr:hypothetical protein D0Z07_4026 [Hyphodiscus hymeniophilus]